MHFAQADNIADHLPDKDWVDAKLVKAFGDPNNRAVSSEGSKGLSLAQSAPQ